MMTLLIDTTSNQEVKIGLRIDGKDYWIRKKIDKNKAQVALPMIDKLLKQKKLKLENLNRIEINVNEGSFTGIRVGLSIAQALSFALKIPVLPAQTGKKVIY